jgi:hypothetical protein
MVPPKTSSLKGLEKFERALVEEGMPDMIGLLQSKKEAKLLLDEIHKHIFDLGPPTPPGKTTGRSKHRQWLMHHSSDNGGTPASGSAAGYTTQIPYEIVAYETVTLVSTYNYDLHPTILRGQLGTVPADHPYGGSPAEGSAFVDLSNPNSVFKTSVPSGNIVGNTMYFKFQTFNQYGAAIQDISDCTAYSFALTGATNPTSPNSPGGSYTLTPSPLLYQGKTGGWPGVDGSSTSWTNPDYVYWPSFTANFASGAVDYAANDSGTAAFTGSGQTVFVTIYDPSRSGSGTAHVDSTNANATTPGYVYLGQITSSAAGNSGGTGGSSGSGGPQDPGSTGTWDITVDGAPIV